MVACDCPVLDRIWLFEMSINKGNSPNPIQYSGAENVSYCILQGQRGSWRFGSIMLGQAQQPLCIYSSLCQQNHWCKTEETCIGPRGWTGCSNSLSCRLLPFLRTEPPIICPPPTQKLLPDTFPTPLNTFLSLRIFTFLGTQQAFGWRIVPVLTGVGLPPAPFLSWLL